MKTKFAKMKMLNHLAAGAMLAVSLLQSSCCMMDSPDRKPPSAARPASRPVSFEHTASLGSITVVPAGFRRDVRFTLIANVQPNSGYRVISEEREAKLTYRSRTSQVERSFTSPFIMPSGTPYPRLKNVLIPVRIPGSSPPQIYDVTLQASARFTDDPQTPVVAVPGVLIMHRRR